MRFFKPRGRGPAGRLRRSFRGSAGLTLVEVIVAFALLVIGLLGYLQALVLSSAASQNAREHALAAEAAREVMETIKARTFADVFKLYNADPNDDPGGAGTGPGRNFQVDELNCAATDGDGFPGEVLFPTDGLDMNVLREDVADVRFGTPRDLDRDNAIDAANHADDYQILPVAVRVRWRSKAGTASFLIKTLLVELP